MAQKYSFAFCTVVSDLCHVSSDHHVGLEDFVCMAESLEKATASATADASTESSITR